MLGQEYADTNPLDAGENRSRPGLANPSSPGMNRYAFPNVSCQHSIPSNLTPILNPFSWMPGCKSRTGTGSHCPSVLNIGKSPGGSQGADAYIPGYRKTSSWTEKSRWTTKPTEKWCVTLEARENSRESWTITNLRHICRVSWKRVKNCPYYASEGTWVMALTYMHVVGSRSMSPFIIAGYIFSLSTCERCLPND